MNDSRKSRGEVQRRRGAAQYFWIVLLVLPWVLIVYRIFMLESGYCSRNNSYLTDDRATELAIRHLIRTYPPTIQSEETRLVDGAARKFLRFYKPESPVHYVDIDDFRSHNPGCCVIVSAEPETWYEMYWLGFTRTVYADYQVRYATETGKVRSVRVRDHVIVSTCGATRYLWDD